MNFGSSIRDLLGNAPEEARDAEARDAEARDAEAREAADEPGSEVSDADRARTEPGAEPRRHLDGPGAEDTMERHDMDEAVAQGGAVNGMQPDRQLSTADVARAAAPPMEEAPAAPAVVTANEAASRPTARITSTAVDDRASDSASPTGDGGAGSTAGAANPERTGNARPSPVGDTAHAPSSATPGAEARADDRQDDGERPAPLFAADQTAALREQWTDLQAGFVDEPRRAVQQADGLVAEVIQRLAQSFADERSQLERQWDGGGDVSTEELRVALRRYRSFFDRLLSL